ncbi:MAG TPA: response regulator transcription factor [Acidimicrobiales bacterium]|jgi:DNA-binding response OmpR family regulator
MRVLVVEDEEALASSIARGLRREGFAVDVVGDGPAALEKVGVNRYDVLVLDRNLPGRSGDSVCREVAGTGDARILMLTAAASVEERVQGLALGADDYLPKPFAFAELVARVRALGRRTTPALPVVLECGDLALDPARRHVTRAGRRLDLTNKEFGVLEALMAARGAVISVEALLERVWDEHTDPFTNTVRVTVMNLRRKLGDPPVIETIVGAGYQLPCPA